MQARIKNPSLAVRGALEHRHLDRRGDSWRVLPDGIAGNEGRALDLQRFAGLLGREG